MNLSTDFWTVWDWMATFEARRLISFKGLWICSPHFGQHLNWLSPHLPTLVRHGTWFCEPQKSDYYQHIPLLNFFLGVKYCRWTPGRKLRTIFCCWRRVIMKSAGLFPILLFWPVRDFERPRDRYFARHIPQLFSTTTIRGFWAQIQITDKQSKKYQKCMTETI